MATRRQHYVPQVYMKAWETEVETITEPDKKFQGVYVFKQNGVVSVLPVRRRDGSVVLFR